MITYKIIVEYLDGTEEEVKDGVLEMELEEVLGDYEDNDNVKTARGEME